MKRFAIWALALGLALQARAGEIEDLKGRAPLAPAAVQPSPPPTSPRGAAVDKPSAEGLRPLNIYFISVGQGDAEYIELPDGDNALIDGGPDPAALGSFLQRHNVSRIGHVVLTHPHSDHYNGLNYVFDSIEVGAFYDTRMDNTGATGDEKVRAKAERAARDGVSYPRPGEGLDWGAGVAVKVFNSCPDEVRSTTVDDRGQDVNDCSIVLKLTAEGRSALLEGDVQADVEARMVEDYGDELRADILKVAHHGSAYSSTDDFLAKVKPRWAVIGVGKNNYGHPTQAALTRLEHAGAEVFRTDQDGDVSGSDFVEKLLAKRLGGWDPSPEPGAAAADYVTLR